MLSKECLTCKRTFYKGSNKSLKIWINEVKYCSKKCSQTIFKKGMNPWNKNKIGVMPVAWNKGKKIGLLHSHPFKKGVIPAMHNLGCKCFRCTGNSWNKNKPWSKDMKIKMSAIHQGVKLDEWKGFSSTERERAMSSPKYKSWREGVFQRDDFTCLLCNKRGVKLQADHIKPWSLYKSLRFDLSNGRTLCVDCHKKTETYGYKLFNFVSDDASGK